MVVQLRKITYFMNGKKYSIRARLCTTMFSQGSGLMFRKNSPPLFFIFKKERILDITSLFCKPFKALWLDKNMRVIKVVDVNGWKFHIKGYGKYLLEIPKTTKK